jgi:N-acetylglutamate synthase-like GNAT family acetyltransferase
VDGETLRIRAARHDEAPLLSTLGRRSKGYWGYSDAFLDACRAELTVSAESIGGGATFVLEAGGSVVGFYTLDVDPGGECELEHLFVEPDVIGRGHGRRLMCHALAQARAAGARTLRVQSDPNAAAFYRAIGGRDVGETPSASVPGRVLPVLVIDVDL